MRNGFHNRVSQLQNVPFPLLHVRYVGIRHRRLLVLWPMSKLKPNSLGNDNRLPSPATSPRIEQHYKASLVVHHAAQHRSVQSPRIPRARMATLLFVALVFYAFCGYITLGRSSSPENTESVESILESNTSILGTDTARWAQYSPYYPVETYTSPSEGCEVDQVSSHRWLS